MAGAAHLRAIQHDLLFPHLHLPGGPQQALLFARVFGTHFRNLRLQLLTPLFQFKALVPQLFLTLLASAFSLASCATRAEPVSNPEGPT